MNIPENDLALIALLKVRFERHMHRHADLQWADVEIRLRSRPGKLRALREMETTSGEPDVIGYDAATGEYLFCDCSAESPSGRRSLCYDRAAQESRKSNPPQGNAMDMAAAMGITLLTEA